MTNRYEGKLEARRERFEELAAKNSERSVAYDQAGRRAVALEAQKAGPGQRS